MSFIRRIGLGFLCLFCVNAFATEAPDFTLPDRNDEPLTLSEQQGKVVMLNFWASWCAPCIQEMPALDELYNDLKDQGFTLIGVNVEQDRTAAEALLERVGVSFPIVFDPEGSTRLDYRIRAMPTTILVDREGVIQQVNRGYRPGDEDKYREQVLTLLKK
ncbi:TlpA family protein disulfide reductase [Marinimicrobium alkaliphilum]|uniref:TlpA family protein disulfide reductase n=1 Tax=Marinimicrobium alkaliphilum TaxID=2202654 RepID=UPI000DBA3C6C|nr:TlpA disulfide reductase family protein [Marinimicrobium alkaliphilum]